MLRQTTHANAATVERKWYVVDATDLPLGRLASEIAMTLMGKNKPEYTHMLIVEIMLSLLTLTRLV